MQGKQPVPPPPRFAPGPLIITPPVQRAAPRRPAQLLPPCLRFYTLRALRYAALRRSCFDCGTASFHHYC